MSDAEKQVGLAMHNEEVERTELLFTLIMLTVTHGVLSEDGKSYQLRFNAEELHKHLAGKAVGFQVQSDKNGKPGDRIASAVLLDNPADKPFWGDDDDKPAWGNNDDRAFMAPGSDTNQ